MTVVLFISTRQTFVLVSQPGPYRVNKTAIRGERDSGWPVVPGCRNPSQQTDSSGRCELSDRRARCLSVSLSSCCCYSNTDHHHQEEEEEEDCHPSCHQPCQTVPCSLLSSPCPEMTGLGTKHEAPSRVKYVQTRSRNSSCYLHI